MTIHTRTELSRILRRLNQGLLTPQDAYHAVCNLLAASAAR